MNHSIYVRERLDPKLQTYELRGENGTKTDGNDLYRFWFHIFFGIGIGNKNGNE